MLPRNSGWLRARKAKRFDKRYLAIELALSEATSSSERRTELSSNWYYLIMSSHKVLLDWNACSQLFLQDLKSAKELLAMLSILEVYQMISAQKCANLQEKHRWPGSPSMEDLEKAMSVLTKASHQPRLKIDSSICPCCPSKGIAC